MIPCQRHAFDIPDDVAYFNCSYMAPTLVAARQAATAALARTSQPWQVAPGDFFAPPERARALFAQLIGASSDDVAIVSSVSYGISTAAKNLRLRRGQTILLLEGEFPSNVYPWYELARRDGGTLRFVPRPGDSDWTAAILRSLDDDVAVAALPHCHWTDGSLVDLARVSPALQERGIKLVLDVTQSLGALPLDVSRIKVDFLACAAYKWLLGPYGLSFLYASAEHHSGDPLDYNWINRERSEDFAGLVNYRDGYQAGARRYDMGERSSFVLIPMAIAALEQLLAWTPAAIMETLGAITDELAARLRELGVHSLPAPLRSRHILGVQLTDGAELAAGLVEQLRARKVFVSVRGQTARLAPHLWITPGDIARLLEAVAELRAR